MKTETIALLKKFEEITGVTPKSASLGVGSMRPYVRFKMNHSPEIAEFVKNENYYQPPVQQDFRGIHIKFLDNSFEEDWHKKNGYVFWVEINKLK